MQDWMEENYKKVAILLVMVSVIGAVVLVLGSSQPADTIGPENTMLPTPKPLNTIIPILEYHEPYNASNTTVTPAPTIDPSYADYLYWREHYANKTNTSSVTPTATPIEEGDPALTNGARIYVPTPTPTPTPLPPEDPMSREVHAPLQDYERQYLPPDTSKDSIQTGTLAIANTTGLYSYYHRGDHAALKIAVVSNTYTTITNPTIDVKLKAHAILNNWITISEKAWVQKCTITPAFNYNPFGGREYLQPGMTMAVYEFDVPSDYTWNGVKLDTNGLYMIDIKVYADNIQACGMTKQVAIL